MQPSIKLPFSFDRERLKDDAARIAEHEWTPHFNTGVYEGEWDGIALRSTGGRTDKLYPDPNAVPSCVDTEIIGRCPYFQEVLASFQCPLNAVRILRLRPGAKICEHRDYDIGYELGEVRIHIPIQTGSEVLFFVDRCLVTMQQGEVWYVDVSLPHAVENRGTTDRLHLIIDCQVNEWLTGLLTAETCASTAPPIKSALFSEGLDRFREFVSQDSALQEQLYEVLDPEQFASLVVSLGKDRQCKFTASDIKIAMRDGRSSWMERWIA